MVEMKVSQLSVDPFSNQPLLVLADGDGRHSVPIWIAAIEASAIAAELKKIPLQRPMTHDLLHSVVGACGARVLRVEIQDMRDTTFYAAIILGTAAGEKQLDARPADAIALALRAGAPIRVARAVVEKAQNQELPAPTACALDHDVLENLSDEDFGKWKM